MTLDEFIKYWDGKYCETAGTSNALNQCVDLANAYIREVLNLPIIEWTNAIDFPSKAGDKYEYILNTITGVPQKGDLIIWKPSPGHIAIFIEGNTDRFSSFDQNFPLNSVCHIQEHSYFNVIGWLHPKEVTTLPVEKKVFEELVRKATELDKFVAEGFQTALDTKKRFASQEGLLQSQRDLTKQFETQAKELQAKLDAIPPVPPDCFSLKERIKPLVTSGWFTYLRSRGALQQLIV